MRGNWSGLYTGTNSGRIVVELDDRGSFSEGCAYAYDNNKSLPTVVVLIRTPSKASGVKFKAPVALLDEFGEFCTWQKISGQYSPGTTVPNEVEIECEWSADRLKLMWTTDIGTNGQADIPKSEVALPSTCTPEPIISWKEFKEYVVQLEPYRYVFRGQSDVWRLRTPFHRTGRGDLRRFFKDDVAILHRHLTACTEHFFNLADPLQNAAFLHLAQHHGYPTPLLDWTYSPFVAAYFAYRRMNTSDLDNVVAEGKSGYSCWTK